MRHPSRFTLAASPVRTVLLATAWALSVAACSSGTGGAGKTSGSSGQSSSGGATGNGGAAGSGATSGSGGITGSAGVGGTGGSTTTISTGRGGVPGSGGSLATGGVSGSGGKTGTGGASPVGGSSDNDGSIASDGSSILGGSSGTGGTKAMGGSAASGGSPATGGMTGTGGIKATGGSPASGGTTATGGTQSPGTPLAFPGAVGFGKNATGGRGNAVYHVTNLNDSGAGSFRDAVSQGKRIVVFDLGGYVNLQSAVSVKSDLTIAGQTSPGDGIGFMGREVSFNAAANVIVRYVRFRQGLLDPDAKKSGINLLNASIVILDHVSIEFAQYDNIDAVGATNITVQNSINANPTGQQFGAHTEMTGGFFTWYGNLWANAHGRQPLAKANTQFVNNVVYNYGYAYCAGDTSGIFWHDIVDNYFIAGPSTSQAGDDFYQMNSGQTVYVKGNLLDSNKDGTLNGTDAGYPGSTTHATSASSPDTASLATTSAPDTYTTVLADAGASLHRDQVDALVVADVKSLGKAGTLWTDQTATGLDNSGYGTLAGGTAPVDTDQDGMPDTWETKYGLNPNSAADATGDFDRTGYTNIEKYVNSIADGLYP